MKYILLFISLITLNSCNTNGQTADSFAQEIVDNIKNKNAEKIYALFMTPQETALYGFQTSAISTEEMDNMSSPDEYIQIITEKVNKNKAFEIKTINQYIAHFNTLFDWQKAKITKIESNLLESKKVHHFKDRSEAECEIYDLTITLKLEDNKERIIKIKKAMKLAGRWLIFPIHSFGIEVPE
ncbi:hypothetical protein [Flavobacterium foetidum]|uniref:hypothetical protein n=1 Tax=Flavobacterium foetidum TaxID=2026681 RepID=UPI001074F919|nr:hypothetical protein [Flavobacterium foetidum]KAF2516590.1 hypothetical protein E0W73_05725 [Flavobacterium foetidum]